MAVDGIGTRWHCWRSVTWVFMRQLLPSPVDNVSAFEIHSSLERPPHVDRPWVYTNMIASIDGAVSTDGLSGGLGGPPDKVVFEALRGVADAILVGAGTAIAENYRRAQTSETVQEVRLARGQSARPRIVVISNRLSILPSHRVFHPQDRPLVVTTESADPNRRAAIAEVAEVVTFGRTDVQLERTLGFLREQGIERLLCEGGPSLNGSLSSLGLIDEWTITASPLLVGGTSGRIVAGSDRLDDRFALRLVLEEDSFLFTSYVRASSNLE